MKTLKNYLKMALLAIITVLTGASTKASDNDTFGENVAKAVLFHWSPKPEHIKTVENDAPFDHNQEKENEYDQNISEHSFED
jgi:hypothetical protein